MKIVGKNIWIIFILIVCGFILWPLWKSGFYISDDGEWMVIRLSAFFQSWREGQFPVRFLGRLNHSYGYPVANFLYPGYLYIGSMVHALGFSFVDSVKIILGGAIVGASVFIYLWLKQRFSSFASFFGSLAFLFSPYLLFDLYTRGSVGEVLAFLPGAAAIYSIESKKKYVFAGAVALLIISHNTLALLFVGLFFILIVFGRFIDFLWPLVVGVGMASFFWLPALFERKFVIFDDIVVSNPMQYLIGWDNIKIIGAANIIACLLLVIQKQKKRTPTEILFVVLFVIATISATTIATPLWSINILGKLIQFPYRMLSIVTLVAPWIFAALIERTQRRRTWIIGVFLCIWVISTHSVLGTIEHIDRPEGYYTTNEATTNVLDEYMPRWVGEAPTRRAVTKFEAVGGKAVFNMVTATTQKIITNVEAEDELRVQLNVVYYPGWGVLVDGVQVPIDYTNERGLMQFIVPAGSHRVHAEFRETPARFAADVLALISGVAFIILVLRERRGYT